MKGRGFLYILVGLVLAGVLVTAATNVAMNTSKKHLSWQAAQETTPILWMVDGCAGVILLGAMLFGMSAGSSRNEEQARQIATLAHTVEELYHSNMEYAARVEALESTGENERAADDDHEPQALNPDIKALSETVEANARQLEAISLALRHQRSEMKTMRAAFKSGILPPEDEAPVLEAAPPTNALAAGTEPVDTAEPVEEPVIEAPVEPEIEPAAEEPEAPEAVIVAPEPEETASIEEPAAASSATDNAVETDELSERTVNAQTTLVTSLDLDAAAEEEPELNGKQRRAAEEFRRSKQDSGSIFRNRRP